MYRTHEGGIGVFKKGRLMELDGRSPMPGSGLKRDDRTGNTQLH